MLSVTRENREETSQPWDGPCEGKSVELKQLLESICADIQAAVMDVCCAQSLYSFTSVEEQLSRSQPPSQEYLTPCDTALICLNRHEFVKIVRVLRLLVNCSTAVCRTAPTTWPHAHSHRLDVCTRGTRVVVRNLHAPGKDKLNEI